MQFHSLEDQQTFEEVLNLSQEKTVVIFKHSISCPTSAYAHGSLERLDEASDPPVWKLVVQQNRELSHVIASQLGIRHESPQIILLREGKVIHHASHGSVRAENVRKVANQELA